MSCILCTVWKKTHYIPCMLFKVFWIFIFSYFPLKHEFNAATLENVDQKEVAELSLVLLAGFKESVEVQTAALQTLNQLFQLGIYDSHWIYYFHWILVVFLHIKRYYRFCLCLFSKRRCCKCLRWPMASIHFGSWEQNISLRVGLINILEYN